MRINRLQIFWAEDWTYCLFPIFPAGGAAAIWFIPPALDLHAGDVMFWVIVLVGVIACTMGTLIPFALLRSVAWLRPCPHCGVLMERRPQKGPGKVYQCCPACGHEHFTGVRYLASESSSPGSDLGGPLLDAIKRTRK